MIVTVTDLPFVLFVTLTLEPNFRNLCAAVIALSSSGMPLRKRAMEVKKHDEGVSATLIAMM